MIGYADFPRTVQFRGYTCGPCCAYSIATFFGADVSYGDVKDALGTDRDGTEERSIVKFLRAHGMRVKPRPRLAWRELLKGLAQKYVVLVGLDGDHYGVVHAYDADEDEVYLADPSIRRQLGRRVSSERFRSRWDGDGVLIRRRRR